MARVRKLVGIRRKRNGWQAFIWIEGKFYSKQFPIETPLSEMHAWREQALVRHSGEIRPVVRGGFEEDVRRYLAKPDIAAQKYIAQRAKYLDLWVAALGRERARRTIVRDEVEAVLQEWLRAGFAPATVYHRRSALLALFVRLDGKHVSNPVYGTTCPPHWRPIDRSVPFATLQLILAAMPNDRIDGAGIRQPSLAKLRVAVLMYTGMPPSELMKLQRHHFDREMAQLKMPWREKGQGRPAYTLPLSRAAVAALIALDVAQGWGAFPTEMVGRSFKRAARRVLGDDTTVKLYDLRHSFGAEAYRQTRDLATVGRLLGHVEGSKVTAQYARGAHAEVDRAAVDAMEVARAAAKPAEFLARPIPPLPAKTCPPRKLLKMRKIGVGS